ncbi:chromosome segregation protein SMC [Megamonas hypermegale]|uniref:Chromosome segregation protein SMC n=2 Tax=Megamonas hypermegale TaxID=158847 RepID=A0A239TB06_9FIRM|nr:hypothetical protein [Megamonas hypermegale]SNU94144.1 chromosome segregation protein SMC [Megamonas hypermegale]
MIFENVGVSMGDIKIKKKLVNFIEECIERYIDEHLVDLKRKILNLDGFKSDEEYKNLQSQYSQIKDENGNLQRYIDDLHEEKNELEHKKEILEVELEENKEKIYKLKEDFYKSMEHKCKKNDVLKISLNECEERLSKINEENDILKEKLIKYETNLDRANNAINDIKNEAGKMIDSMKEKIKEAQQQKEILDYFSNRYGEIDSMFKTYQQLNEDIRDELQGIFGNADTPVMFFCNALQENHLDNFWDYISNKINSGKIDRNIEKSLCKLFDFCFDMVNNSQQKPLYKRLQVQKGFDFDNTYMIKTTDSSQLGNVKEVKLAGYVYTLSNKIVRRSLVQVESED